jgi:putative membrane protein
MYKIDNHSESIQNIDPKDLMAVERATTALIGTSISLIILGFIVEKFELFLHIIAAELKGRTGAQIPQLAHISFYNYLGITIVVAGIVLALYTYRYYVSWIQHLEKKEINTDKSIYLVLAIFIALIGAVLVLSMILV